MSKFEKISRNENATPDGFYQESGHATAMAWGNYNELTDSLITLHLSTNDTQRVVIQNKKPDGVAPPPDLGAVSFTDGSPPTKKMQMQLLGKACGN